MQHRRLRTVLGLAAVVVAGGAASWLGWFSSADAGEAAAYRARLLVKCDASEVGDILRALKGRDVEVYDLDSMKRLGVAPAASATEKRVPRLPDAVALMDELLRALAAVQADSGVPPWRVESMAIQSRRAMVKIEGADAEDLGGASAALTKLRGLTARAGKPQLGALQRLKSGGWRTSLVFRFPDDDPREALAPPAQEAAALAQFQQAEHAARMQKLWASPVKDDRNRSGGYRTITRGFVYQPATLAQLRTLLRGLTQTDGKPNGLTVSEIRWKLVDEKDRADDGEIRIAKPTIEVGYREKLP